MARPEANVALPDLDDPNQFVHIERVAILDVDSNPDHYLQEGYLETILEQTNDRIEGGDLILLTIGHMDDDLPETNQPPLIGYATDLVMGELNGKTVILADMYIIKDRYEEAMTYPRRSVELYHDKDYTTGFIDIVSFLRRTPARSLGLLTFKNYGNRTIYCCPQMGDEMTNEDLEKLADMVAAKLSVSKFAKDEDEPKCDDMEEDEDKIDKKKKTKKSKEDSDDEKEDEKEELEEDDDMVDDFDASCAAGDNTFVPGVVDKKKAKKMRRDSDRIKLSRLETTLGEMIEERDRYKLLHRRLSRELDLKQLEAEGVQFDPVAELEYVERLDDEAYATHLSRVRTNYRKFPVGKPMIQTAAEKKVGTSKEDIAKVVKFAKDHNIKDFAVALDTYNKTEVK